MLDTLTAYYEIPEDAFRDLQKRLDQEISLLLVGDGEDDALLQKKCERESIQNVIFAGFHQKSELPRFLCNYGIHLYHDNLAFAMKGRME